MDAGVMVSCVTAGADFRKTNKIPVLSSRLCFSLKHRCGRILVEIFNFAFIVSVLGRLLLKSNRLLYFTYWIKL